MTFSDCALICLLTALSILFFFMVEAIIWIMFKCKKHRKLQNYLVEKKKKRYATNRFYRKKILKLRKKAPYDFYIYFDVVQSFYDFCYYFEKFRFINLFLLLFFSWATFFFAFNWFLISLNPYSVDFSYLNLSFFFYI